MNSQPPSNPLFHGDPNTVVDALGLRSSKDVSMHPNRLVAMRMVERNLRAEGHTSRADCIAELCNEIERLQQALALTRTNIEGVLDVLGTDAIRVREGGGPEDILASLALSVSKLQKRAGHEPCLGCARLAREAHTWWEALHAVTAHKPPDDVREFLGKLVRAEWVKWAREQPNPKPSWLVPWDELGEPDREADRRIGESIWRFSFARDVAQPPVCGTCNGRREVGGFINAESGYQNDPCPDCSAPPPSVDQNVYESAVKGRQDFRQALRGMRDRAAFGPDTSTDDATWLLCLLQDQEISVSKAREWLREWIRDGVKGPLPDSPALTNTVRCNCAGIAPTMPTFRTEHLPTCPCSGITKSEESNSGSTGGTVSQMPENPRGAGGDRGATCPHGKPSEIDCIACNYAYQPATKGEG